MGPAIEQMGESSGRLQRPSRPTHHLFGRRVRVLPSVVLTIDRNERRSILHHFRTKLRFRKHILNAFTYCLRIHVARKNESIRNKAEKVPWLFRLSASTQSALAFRSHISATQSTRFLKNFARTDCALLFAERVFVTWFRSSF